MISDARIDQLIRVVTVVHFKTVYSVFQLADIYGMILGSVQTSCFFDFHLILFASLDGPILQLSAESCKMVITNFEMNDLVEQSP